MPEESLPAIIAVVDDDDCVRCSITSLLRSCGWAVRAYACGIALLSEIDRLDVRLLIADVQMPEMDGFALLEQIVARNAHIPVVFITAYPMPSMIAKIEKAGAKAHLSKPLNHRQLLSCVARIVG